MAIQNIYNFKIDGNLSISRPFSVDTDTTLSSNSDKYLPTQKAVKTYVDNLPKPLTFRGTIALASDFPTLAAVQNGWVYQISANVTDNDPTKTNTGMSFLAGDEIAWDGTTWVALGSVALWDRNYDYGYLYPHTLTDKVGIGIDNPTSWLTLHAGTTDIAPLKFISGTKLSTPEVGAVEFDGNDLYITI